MKKLFSGKSSAADATTELNALRSQLSEITGLLNRVAEGNVDFSLSDALAQSAAGASLKSLKERLQHISVDQQNRDWMNVGLANFSDLLRNKDSLDLRALCEQIIISLCKYLNVNQGAIFIVSGDTEENTSLDLAGCYAYDRRKHLTKSIAPGEGLVGQSYLERDIVYLRQVPANYVTISSGLGEARPREVLIAPLLVNDQVFGVLELASFGEFTSTRMEFIKKLSSNIASAIKSVRDTDRTTALLNASQLQTEALRAQEEEMRQNMEELTATQEEMERKAKELVRSGNEMKGLLAGINATMATIEFTPDGIITDANQNFLNTVRYELTDIKGRHHRMFVSEDERNSVAYTSFWKELAAGQPAAGVFRRSASDGSTIWLNAIYSPLLDADGIVVKVVKFATDITAERSAAADLQGMISGINATMATIEFDPFGHVLTANEMFLNTMGYALADIKGQHHRKFVSVEEAEGNEYSSFWQRLREGEPVSGVFRRYSSTGELIWLQAVYNPIRNASGEVTRIVKFASNVSEGRRTMEKAAV